MNIQIIEDIKEVLQVIIKCPKTDDKVLRLKSYIELFGEKLKAKKDEDFELVNIQDVLYFEAVDNRTFLYTADEAMEIKQRLYELEEMLSDKDFVRISKSQIVNINKIKSLKPELNRTILATMCNGERLSISRRYVQAIKNILSI